MNKLKDAIFSSQHFIEHNSLAFKINFVQFKCNAGRFVLVKGDMIFKKLLLRAHYFSTRTKYSHRSLEKKCMYLRLQITQCYCIYIGPNLKYTLQFHFKIRMHFLYSLILMKKHFCNFISCRKESAQLLPKHLILAVVSIFLEFDQVHC